MPIDFPLIELLSIYYIDFTIGIKFLIIPAIYFNYDRRLFLKKKCFFLQSKKIIFLIKYYLHIYAQHIIYISKRKHLNSTDNQIANINFSKKKKPATKLSNPTKNQPHPPSKDHNQIRTNTHARFSKPICKSSAAHCAAEKMDSALHFSRPSVYSSFAYTARVLFPVYSSRAGPSEGIICFRRLILNGFLLRNFKS